MDDVNKNIPLSTPCPSFFQEEEEEENITVICQEEEEAVQNITREERDAVETMVNLTNKTIVSAVEEESEEEREHKNESTTTPSPVPVALLSPLPTPTVVELSSPTVVELSSPPPPPQLPSVPSPLNTNLLAQYQPVIISSNNNNSFPTQQLIFSPSDFPPPTQEIEEIFYNQSIPPPNVIANKNDCYTKNNRSGGKNVNFMRQLYEKEEMKIGNEDDDDDDDDNNDEKKVKSELRQTTKNNRWFHRTLFLKKKECYVRQFPILLQKNADLVVCAENKFKEIARIYTLKKYIEKNMDLKEAIFDLELMEHRYRNEVERVNKKKK